MEIISGNLENLEAVLRSFASEIGEQDPEGLTAIVDIAGVNSGIISRLSFLRKVSGTAAEFYPEITRKVYLVNAPWIFPRLYQLVKPFL